MIRFIRATGAKFDRICFIALLFCFIAHLRPVFNLRINTRQRIPFAPLVTIRARLHIQDVCPSEFLTSRPSPQWDESTPIGLPMRQSEGSSCVRTSAEIHATAKIAVERRIAFPNTLLPPLFPVLLMCVSICELGTHKKGLDLG